MILHASIQLFSRTAPRKQEFSTARKATAGATLLARVDFIRNVGEPFEGVREPPFPTGARLSIYAHTTGSFVFPLAKSRPPRVQERTTERPLPPSPYFSIPNKFIIPVRAAIANVAIGI